MPRRCTSDLLGQSKRKGIAWSSWEQTQNKNTRHLLHTEGRGSQFFSSRSGPLYASTSGPESSIFFHFRADASLLICIHFFLVQLAWFVRWVTGGTLAWYFWSLYSASLPRLTTACTICVDLALIKSRIQAKCNPDLSSNLWTSCIGYLSLTTRSF